MRAQAWDNLRPECAEQLRQPLCLALLRNCTSPYDEVALLPLLNSHSSFIRTLCRCQALQGPSRGSTATSPCREMALLEQVEKDECRIIQKAVIFDTLID